MEEKVDEVEEDEEDEKKKEEAPVLFCEGHDEVCGCVSAYCVCLLWVGDQRW